MGNGGGGKVGLYRMGGRLKCREGERSRARGGEENANTHERKTMSNEASDVAA